MTTLRRLFTRGTRGRVSVWWWTHRHQARSVALATGLVAIIGAVGYFDHQDEIAHHDLMVARTQAMIRERELIERLPTTLFILEAKTVDGAVEKLSRVAGSADAERYQLQYQLKEKR